MPSQLSDEIGEKEEVPDVVSVGDIEVPALREWLDPFHLGGELGQIGRPKRGGAFEHGSS